jgi:NAD(P)-dependent dehydrogenase (short-subunit alcohol dehydrogenase family)
VADLQGKVVIVTGAGGGIGRAACLVLARAAARLIVSDVVAAAGEATVEAVRQEKGEATFVAADLGDRKAIEALVSRTLSIYGRLDGAFNNAGLEQRAKPLVELSVEEWDRAIQIDLTSVFLCLKYQIPAMLKTGGGSIVNTASSLGQVAIPNCAEYVAAKHGVIGVTRAAAADYGAKGVRVNAILPGVTRTPMIERLIQDASFSAYFERLRQRHPIGRFGEPHEIGEACAWLLSDAASFMNGAALAVDGGYLAV